MIKCTDTDGLRRVMGFINTYSIHIQKKHEASTERDNDQPQKNTLTTGFAAM